MKPTTAIGLFLTTTLVLLCASFLGGALVSLAIVALIGILTPIYAHKKDWPKLGGFGLLLLAAAIGLTVIHSERPEAFAIALRATLVTYMIGLGGGIIVGFLGWQMAKSDGLNKRNTTGARQ